MKLNAAFKYSRYAILIAIVGAALGQLLMLYIGAEKIFNAFSLYILKPDISALPEHVKHSDVATVLLIQALDAFLIAVVLMYFSFSLYRLFISDNAKENASIFPGDIAPKNIGELKQTLAQVIVVVLFILFLQEIWLELESLEWTILVLPISIVLLALSIKFIQFKE